LWERLQHRRAAKQAATHDRKGEEADLPDMVVEDDDEQYNGPGSDRFDLDGNGVAQGGFEDDEDMMGDSREEPSAQPSGWAATITTPTTTFCAMSMYCSTMCHDSPRYQPTSTKIVFQIRLPAPV
jgi:hypothetical protein